MLGLGGPLVLPFPQILGTGPMALPFTEDEVSPWVLVDLRRLSLVPWAALAPVDFRPPGQSYPRGQCEAGGLGCLLRAHPPARGYSSFPCGVAQGVWSPGRVSRLGGSQGGGALGSHSPLPSPHGPQGRSHGRLGCGRSRGLLRAAPALHSLPLMHSAPRGLSLSPLGRWSAG